MSSKAKKVSDKIVQQRLSTVVQVLSILESEAEKKNFFHRIIIGFQYIFTGRIDVFFKVGKK